MIFFYRERETIFTRAREDCIHDIKDLHLNLFMKQFRARNFRGDALRARESTNEANNLFSTVKLLRIFVKKQARGNRKEACLHQVYALIPSIYRGFLIIT